MVLEEFSGLVKTFLNNIDFYNVILPLLIYTVAIAVYAVFVWFFYTSVSKRDLFKREVGGKLKTLNYVLKYFVLFPALVFFWFGVLTLLLFFVSKTQTTEAILLISVALISAVRVTAYIKEALSVDVAKILPLAVLGIFIVEPTFFAVDLIYQRVAQVPGLVIQLFNYLLFVIILEFLLRTGFYLKTKLSRKNSFDIE